MAFAIMTKNMTNGLCNKSVWTIIMVVIFVVIFFTFWHSEIAKVII